MDRNPYRLPPPNYSSCGYHFNSQAFSWKSSNSNSLNNNRFYTTRPYYNPVLYACPPTVSRSEMPESRDRYERNDREYNLHKRKEFNREPISKIQSSNPNLRKELNKISVLGTDLPTQRLAPHIASQNINLTSLPMNISPMLLSERCDIHSSNNYEQDNKNKTSDKKDLINAFNSINNVLYNMRNKMYKEIPIKFSDYHPLFTVTKKLFIEKVDVTTQGKYFAAFFEFNLLKPIKSIKCSKKKDVNIIIRISKYNKDAKFQTESIATNATITVNGINFCVSQIDKQKKNYTDWMFPIDITKAFLDSNLNYSVSIVWNETVKPKKLCVGVYYIKRCSVSQIINSIINDKTYGKRSQNTFKKIIHKAFSESNGISMDSIKCSLICPISKIRVNVPCVGSDCKHLTCFDGKSFLELTENKFSWSCPICLKPIKMDDLQYDELTTNILKDLPADCTSIEFDKHGNFKPSKENLVNANKEQILISDDLIVID